MDVMYTCYTRLSDDVAEAKRYVDVDQSQCCGTSASMGTPT